MTDFVAAGNISRLLIEHVPAAVAVFDAEMRYIACSKRWLSDYGLGDQDIIGKLHYEIFPEISPAWRQAHRRALAGEAQSSQAEPFPRMDGQIEWVAWEILPWHSQSGAIGGVILITEVLTDAVQKKLQVRSLDTLLDLFVASAQEYAVTLTDLDGKVTYWNAGSQWMYGWTQEEIVGQSIALVLPLEERAAWVLEGNPQRMLSEGTLRSRGWRVRKDGTRFMVDSVLSPIRGDDGEPIGFGGVVRDITADIEQSRKAAESEAYLQSILDTVPDAMVTIDDRGTILSFSGVAEDLFGYSASETVGRNVAMLTDPAVARDHDDFLASYRSTGERRIIGNVRRLFGRRKDGTLFPHALYVGEANGGERTVFTGFLRDLTAQEEAEDQLRTLQAELVHISRVSAIGTMATALAHELNQPLAAISNYLQSAAALLSRSDDAVLALVHEALREAAKQALRAGTIVQRLRQFVAQKEIERSLAAPKELAELAIDLAAVGGKSRQIACNVRIAPDLPMVLVDKVQIQQVLLNLIRNAFDALSERGNIAVEAEQDGEMIRFGVVDDGPGIEPGREEAVFEPFISSKASGMGMGLAICRTIVEAHGGRMWCEPAPGGGAAFRFTVPVAQVQDD